MVFTPEMTSAFEQIKQGMLENVSLSIADTSKPFVLDTDASSWAVGAVLQQYDQNGVLRPVAYFSRKLTGDLTKRTGQKGWSPQEQETYAIVAALEKYQHWINGQPVTVRTDHKSLESWHKERVDTLAGPLGRRGRWHEFLSRFNLTVEYLPGTDNTTADTLSRWAYPACEDPGDTTFDGSVADNESVKNMEKELLELEKELLNPRDGKYQG